MTPSRPPLTRSALWLLTGRLVGLAFTAAIPIVLVRQLSIIEFGLYKQVFLLVNSAVTILPIGFAMTAFYFFNATPKQRREVVSHVVVFHAAVLALAAATLALDERVLPALFGTRDLLEYRGTIAWLIVLVGLAGLLDTLLAAAQEFRNAAVWAAASQFSRAAALIAGAAIFRSLEGVVIAALVHAVVQVLFVVAYLQRRYSGFWRRFSGPLMRRQLSYGLPLGFAGLVYYVQVDLPQYLVARWFGPADFAVYAVGSFQLPLVGILLHAVGSVLIPRTTQLRAEERHAEVVEVVTTTLRKLAIVYFGLYAFFVVSARDVIVLLFTAQYEASVPLFAIHLTLIPLHALMLDPLLRAYEEHRFFLLRLRMILLLFLVVLLWAGSRAFGLPGAAAAVIAVAIAERVTLSVRLFSRLPWSRRASDHVRRTLLIGAAAAVAAAVAYLVTPATGLSELWRLIFRGAIFGPLYAGLLLMLGVLLPEERRVLFAWAQHARLMRSTLKPEA